MPVPSIEKRQDKVEAKLDKKIENAMKKAQSLQTKTGEEPISVHSSQRAVVTVDSGSESERMAPESDEIEDKVDGSTIRAA